MNVVKILKLFLLVVCLLFVVMTTQSLEIVNLLLVQLRPHKRVARAPVQVTTLTISIATPPRFNSQTQL